ncbi:apolipoprotein D-like [Saccostrea echinata]|uniref:apolipoprotein D-like n=1 Tax=Saccostrea echinata TaxID=191078 RepID=UPI002A814800|nr:apolipoprotein D-like [Saccostrea echinata]
MFFKMMLLVIVASFVAVSQAQEFGAFGCPTISTKDNFNLTRYLGTWYEIYKFKANFENNEKCIQANYQLKSNGHIRVNNTGVSISDGSPSTAIGDIYIPDPSVGSRLKVKFASAAPYGNYWVLDTDYENYTLIYSCTSILGISHFEFGWILARSRTLPDSTIQKLFGIMDGYKINTHHFMKTDQSGC